MITDLVQPILHLVDTYGLPALFVFLMLDAAMMLPLFPGELLLILAVNRFAHDQASLAVLAVLASLAATAGNLLLYSVARLGGHGFALAHPRLFLMGPGGIEKVERLFQRPLGWSLVLVLRVVPLLRLLVSLPAGLARMSTVLYSLFTFLGNLLFHAGFLWVTFESSQPDSPVATQAESLRNAYASPAWAYVQSNWLLVAGLILALGLLLSLRASLRAARDPHRPYRGSLVGSVVTAFLFWAGVAVLAGLWVEPSLVYDGIAVTGYDLAAITSDIPFAPLSVVVAAALGSILLSSFFASVGRSARRQAKRSRKLAQFQQDPTSPRKGPP